ncbi:TetR/AcrR family transcriptional regulator [Polycladidibacter stylochi]|uniref:TetR/AcrR family transcriptional regulator n=1 Tax=Polycladidibacter stylochi TaxID=1807766 RepID=UPI00082D3FB7|nr:TetR/AcrR family transcriptional regulator [Pseudovibrio stylochi]
MPKIVDHDAYRMELTQKAMLVFRHTGFAAIGMREIAKELGVSKSSLYHYFPSKTEIFVSVCKYISSSRQKYVQEKFAGRRLDFEEKKKAYFEILIDIDSIFRSHIALLHDYMREIGSEAISNDKNIKDIRGSYLSMISYLFGKEKAEAILCSMLGGMLLRAFGSQSPSIEQLVQLAVDIQKD